MTATPDDDRGIEVPRFDHFFRPVLLELERESPLRTRDVISRVADALRLTEAQRTAAIPSGQSRLDNRTTWACSYLYQAGALTKPRRGIYEITDRGRDLLRTRPDVIDVDDLLQFEEFREFQQRKRDTAAPTETVEPAEGDSPPRERIESAIKAVDTEVAADLLRRLREREPRLFEQAVVDVLLAMGYGGTEQRGKRIGGTADGGVDGVIDQDALGLDQIYVQAKRYAQGNNVGREAIQAFIGALHGFGASRGVFITSSDFTQHARDYAQQIPTRVILIDGTRLAQLMIKYRVGVQVTTTYDLVEVDDDFFE
ncbi:restriction endonuclease [Demequina iriomotensis]|uniref:restriction endonuclease n=1 Tax=Demequina iriomotensis TaxID=1536641 RepID=UPI001E48A908|nr:restriction endonuclease [Demequina iriomotensis]